MRSFLIRCYPARWRERYGDEFLAILEERPLGPFDVADILLGALDARLRQRGRDAHIAHGRGFTMSLRIGGVAAIIGAPLFAGGFALASGTFAGLDEKAGALMVGLGSVALLVALTGLSAFQARTHPALSWTAFALPAIGTIGLAIGALGVVLGREELTGAFYAGLMAFFVGSLLFAIATFATAVLSRPAAALLGIATGLAFAGGGGGESSLVIVIAALVCFTVGWITLGAQAVRIDRPGVAPRPA
jgi:hypothetical protein